MTIYESSYGTITVILLAHSEEDFEMILYKTNENQAFSTKTFKDIRSAFYWLNKDILKTDMACSNCVKKIDRQIARAEQKHSNKIK